MSLAAAIILAGEVTRASEAGVSNDSNYGTAARLISRRVLKYPPGAYDRGQEGWVMVSFVIQADGSVAEAIVENSSGIADFEYAALRSVRQWKYEPATWGGEPIEQFETEFMLTFAIAGSQRRGARHNFSRKYRKAYSLINNGDLVGAEPLIDELTEKAKWNLYEYARLSLLKAMLAQQRGDEQTQLSALHRAVSGQFLEDGVYESLLPVILDLEMRLYKYSAAISTYEQLKEIPYLVLENKRLVESMNSLVDHIRGENPLIIPAKIKDCAECSDPWRHTPVRQEFAFSNVDGELNQFDLRCDWKRLRGDINADRSWRIPKGWGECKIYVYGTAGTTFRFVEYQNSLEGDTDSQNSIGRTLIR